MRWFGVEVANFDGLETNHENENGDDVEEGNYANDPVDELSNSNFCT